MPRGRNRSGALTPGRDKPRGSETSPSKRASGVTHGRRIHFADQNSVHEVDSFKGMPMWLKPVQKAVPTTVSEVIPVGLGFFLCDFPYLDLRAAYFCAPGTFTPPPGIVPSPKRRVASPLNAQLVITKAEPSARLGLDSKATLCSLSSAVPSAPLKLSFADPSLVLRVEGSPGCAIRVVATGKAAQPGYVFPQDTSPAFFSTASAPPTKPPQADAVSPEGPRKRDRKE